MYFLVSQNIDERERYVYVTFLGYSGVGVGQPRLGIRIQRAQTLGGWGYGKPGCVFF